MSQEFGAKWAEKIKELGKTVASIEDSLDGILSSTNGGVRKVSPGGTPVTLKIVSPSIELSANWKFAKSDKNDKVGKQVAFKLNADPIIGMEITIDLLMAAAYGANPAAGRIVSIIKNWAKEDKDIGISGDVFIDLVLSGIIKGSLEFNFNTADKVKKFDGKFATSISIEAKAGVYIKAKGAILIFEATLEAGASIKGKVGLTFGQQLTSDEIGLYYHPMLNFDGLKVTAIIYIEVSLSVKKKGEPSVEEKTRKEKKADFDIFKPFDIIKKMEELTGIKAQIQLIENGNKNLTK